MTFAKPKEAVQSFYRRETKVKTEAVVSAFLAAKTLWCSKIIVSVFREAIPKYQTLCWHMTELPALPVPILPLHSPKNLDSLQRLINCKNLLITVRLT